MPVCKICNTEFKLNERDKKYYHRFKVRTPSECFECNQKKRICFRNERRLYSSNCDFSGESILSIYSPDKPYKVYKSQHWFGDGWDALDYGRDFDFSRPFFQQFRELQMEVPRLALMNAKAENSDYCNMTYGNKDCYLVFGGDFNQSVLYGTLCMKNVNSIDLDYSNGNELCYMMGDCIDCYGCQFTFDSKGCKNCAFISDCTNCKECFLCNNLINSSYCIENIQYSKEEYLKEIKKYDISHYQQQQKIFKQFLKARASRPVKFAHMISCENCTGDYIKNSKNCTYCFDVSDSEDMRNIIFGSKAKNCFNSSFLGDNSEFCYEDMCVLGTVNTRFSFVVIDSADIEYSDLIFNCDSLFGCVGLRHKKYCILNKQYSYDDYTALRKKIIAHMQNSATAESPTGEWGRFFPKEFSCFGYNETVAHDYYPLSKGQALKEGFNWSDAEDKKPETKKVIPASRLPDRISDIPDDILNWGIKCENSGKLFKITPQELRFYRRMKIPVPHLHSEERYQLRLNLRNPRKLYTRACAECKMPIITTYSDETPQKVYCEDCYYKRIS